MSFLLLAALLAAAGGCLPPVAETRDGPPVTPDPFDRPVVTRPAPTAGPAGAPRTFLVEPAAATFEAFLALPESRMDPGLGALLFAAEDFPGLPVEAFLKYLDDLARVVRRRVRGEPNVEWVDAINQVLYFDAGFGYDGQDPHGVLADNLYLHRVVQRKKGYCVSLAVLYLALGRRLGLPIYGVRIPSHFICRFDDGTVRRNIETTDYGIAHPDGYYIRKYRIHPRCVESGVYLKNLTPRQVFADLQNNRGTLRGIHGDWHGALSAFSRGIDIDAGSPFLYYNRAVILTRMGREEEALRDFAVVLELDPNNVFAINNVAEIHANRGFHEKALREVNQALAIFPEYSNGYLNRGVIFHKMGRREQAEENIDKALELDGKNAVAWVYRARLQREKGRWNQAVYDLNRAVASDPLEPLAWAERGVTYQSMNRLDRALPDFDKAVDLAPLVPQFRLGRGVARFKADDLEGAREDFEAARRLAPELPDPLLKLAALDLLQKRHADALARLDEAERLAGLTPSLLVQRAVALQGLRRTDEAEAALRRALEIDPNHGSAHKILGVLCHGADRREEAIRHLERFLALEKGDDPKGREEAMRLLEGLR